MKNVPLRCRMPFRMKLMVHFPVRNFIIWLAPPAGKMNQIARRDWLLERARWSHLSRSGLPAVSRKKNFPESHIINPLLTKLFGQDGWTLASFFFCEFMDFDFVSVHKHAKTELGQYPAILTSHLVNNPYILASFFFCEVMDLDFVSVHKHAKKELGQYPAILTSHLINNPYLLVEINNAKVHESSPAVSSGEERGLLSRTAAGNRA